MKDITLRLVGVAPLMMHNERLANPRDPLTRELKKLTAVRKKTDDTLLEIARLEWRAGLYDVDGHVVLPGDNVLACIKEGARKKKLGKNVESGVYTIGKYFLLEYDGPLNIDELANDERFFDYRSVGVNNARVMRARPIFNDWACTVGLRVDPDLWSADEFLDCVRIAGTMIGLGEKRPQMGRFDVAE